jgi:hypothetical protein
VIEEGLTVSGKPLKDHQEVVGHARAIELIYQGLEKTMSEARLFVGPRTSAQPTCSGYF